jgi:hypothetical protein
MQSLDSKPMKPLATLLFCIIAELLNLSVASAQLNTDSAKKIGGVVKINSDSLSIIPVTRKASYFEAGISYLSNDVYLGRKDSSVLPYYIPELSYYHKSGIYISAYLNYLSSPDASRIDLITLEAGYVFEAGNYDGQLNISKFIYNSQSTSVSSQIQANVGYQNGFDFGAVKSILNLGLDFGTQIDYSASFGLEHGFALLNDKLEFTLGICVNAGTQNFYDNYYKNKRYSNKGKGKTSGNSGTSVTGSVVNPSNFKIMDYEASIPFSYTFHKFVLNFTPTYAIPVNPSLIEVESKQSNGNSSFKTVTEHLTNSFYMSLGFGFKFG